MGHASLPNPGIPIDETTTTYGVRNLLQRKASAPAPALAHQKGGGGDRSSRRRLRMAAEPIEAGKESVCEHARCTLPRASCRCIAALSVELVAGRRRRHSWRRAAPHLQIAATSHSFVASSSSASSVAIHHTAIHAIQHPTPWPATHLLFSLRSPPRETSI